MGHVAHVEHVEHMEPLKLVKSALHSEVIAGEEDYLIKHHRSYNRDVNFLVGLLIDCTVGLLIDAKISWLPFLLLLSSAL